MDFRPPKDREKETKKKKDDKKKNKCYCEVKLFIVFGEKKKEEFLIECIFCVRKYFL